MKALTDFVEASKPGNEIFSCFKEVDFPAMNFFSINLLFICFHSDFMKNEDGF